ncbi:MAG: MBL fold metallo-hydrolase [Verrucomicrobiota bacterium]|nr:MBL fold metallo-hydrolase [Verrucomicrobiota bacterium]
MNILNFGVGFTFKRLNKSNVVGSSFKILGSSSSGNAALLRTGEVNILVDAGFSCKKLQSLLKKEGISSEQLDGIFLTHEHNDHCAGLRGLSKLGNLPIFANRDTIQAIQPKLLRRPNWKIFETGKTFTFKSIKIHPFSVPHDAYDPVGFLFEWGKDDLFDPPNSLAWVTDLGFVPSLVRERIRRAKILVIESNYCTKMLAEDEKRPWSTKQRIRSRHGHLSNQTTFELLDSYQDSHWQKVFLMHLSKDCNNVSIVREQFSKLSYKGKRFETFVVDPLTSETLPI